MKVTKAGAWILTATLTAAMLGGCGGGNSSSASNSASTAQAEATAEASASTETTEEAKPAEEASTAEAASTADEAASDTATDGEAHPGRLLAIVEMEDGSYDAAGDTWMEMNDDGTGTFCKDGTEYAMTYTTEETGDTVLSIDGIVYSVEVEDGTKLQGQFMMEGYFVGVGVDEFMTAEDLSMYAPEDDVSMYMMMEEGSEAWNMMKGE